MSFKTKLDIATIILLALLFIFCAIGYFNNI
jgi:hypothetical protein